MKKYDEERLREEYTIKTKSSLDDAKKLDFKCKLPVYILTYCIGIIGALLLGVGMCLSMKVIGDNVVLGIVLGIVGIILVAINYPIYSKYLKYRKEKYSSQILLALNK